MSCNSSQRILFLTLISLALYQSCSSKADKTTDKPQTDSQSIVASATSTSTTQSVTATDNDFLIVSGERVGPISLTTSEADLLRKLGSSIVTAGDTMYGAEGETYLGTTLYKGTADEVQITYADSTRMRPAMITISPKFLDEEGNPIKNLAPTRWATADGLHIGTTLKEMEKRNGKPFKIWGFAWDYSGMLSDWRGGKMSTLTTKKSSFTLTFGPPEKQTPAQEKAYNNLMGDGEFLSSIPDMQLLNPIVASIGVVFGQ